MDIVRVLIIEMDDSEAALGAGVPKTTVGLVVGGGERVSVVVVSTALGLGVVLEAVLATSTALGLGLVLELESFVDKFDSEEEEVEPMYGHVTVSTAVLLSIPRHAFILVSASRFDSTQQEYTSHCCCSPNSHLMEDA